MNRTAALPRALARRLRSLDKPTRMGLAVVLAVSAGAVGTLSLASSASAAVPTFPDNIVVFPDRDFISVDGFDTHVGETARVVVTRDGQVTGSAEGVLTGGSPSIEINHPGGYCWGTGTGAPNVTPDIQAGDKVSVYVGNELLGDTTTIAANIGAFGGPAIEIDALDPTVLRLRGHIGAGVNLAQLEQRIVEPALTGTEIARRDVRATPGPLTLDARGQYSSSLIFSDQNATTGPVDFVATYEFLNAETAAIAAGGGARAMAWEVEDLDANRQGLTIAEFGELGGPGFGGCPNGPLQSGPPAPTSITVVEATSGGGHNVEVTWVPAVPVPGTPAITGYRVRAVGAQDANLKQAEFGKRVNNATATGTTLTVDGDPNAYTYEVTSVNAAGNETNPAAQLSITPPDETPPTASLTLPAGPYLGATPVTLASTEGGEIYYALTAPGEPGFPDLTDGDVLTGSVPTTLYTAPFDISASTRISVVAFDAAGNPSAQVDQLVTFLDASTPDAPTLTGAVGGLGTIDVEFTAVADPQDAPVTRYDVTWAGPENGSKQVSPGTGTLTTQITGLDAGEYTVTVTARNAVGAGPASGPATATVGEQVTVSAGADKTAVRGGAAVTLNGSSPISGVAYTWQRITTADPNSAVIATSLLSATDVAAPTVTVPVLGLPTSTATNAAGTNAAVWEARNAPLFYKVTATKGGQTAVDVVQVSIQTDTVSIATGRYRAGSELRLNGSVTNGAATVRIYRKNTTAGVTNYVFIGNAVITAAPGGATWELRLRNGQTPTVNGPWYAFSSFGGGAGPFAT
ncbi:fibronectin type III domain-containing protein [Kineosporia sp. A_224]|uniref:fibronectin type III domain-containing protein n=1 Tax=Kineosporia sp. A_224 TaxID=1962180 RepID=UPI000B4BFEF9|nr:fibronectin type III domain-containing protein [Kineosporia sp. A_224]